MSAWLEKSLDKVIQIVQNDVLKKKVQILVLEPLLQHCIDLVFPYVIMICCVIGVMIIILISILAILIYRTAGLTVTPLNMAKAAAAALAVAAASPTTSPFPHS